ncbi:MAG: hypothetical protein ACJARL_000233 [Halopseudomonas sp.]|jgi:hypothetical protein
MSVEIYLKIVCSSLAYLQQEQHWELCALSGEVHIDFSTLV